MSDDTIEVLAGKRVWFQTVTPDMRRSVITSGNDTVVWAAPINSEMWRQLYTNPDHVLTQWGLIPEIHSIDMHEGVTLLLHTPHHSDDVLLEACARLRTVTPPESHKRIYICRPIQSGADADPSIRMGAPKHLCVMLTVGG